MTPEPARPEPVEGLFFFLHLALDKQGFDKLSPSGFFVRGPCR